MKITYDPEVDALYIEFRSAADGTVRNQPISDDVTLDYGPDGGLVGIEILDARAVLGEEVGHITVEVATPALAAGR